MNKREKIERPLNHSILIGIVIFIAALCLVMSVMEYVTYRNILYDEMEDYIRNILTYAASAIDVDDLKECIDTGVESEKFHELQLFLDNLKEHTEMHFMYVVVPLNTEKTDNMKNVIAAVSEYEYETMADLLVSLNQLTGDSYPPSTAAKYLAAYESGELTFFEEFSEWGDDYTGLLPLIDSNGERVAALCMDVEALSIHASLAMQMEKMLLVIVVLGLLFAIGFYFWTDYHITYPIVALEKCVSGFAQNSHNQRDPAALVLDVPEIHTGNEVESLSRAVKQMSEDMSDYVKNILDTEQALEQMNVIALKDGLTGVNNKTAFDRYADELNIRIKAGTEKPEFAILMLDLNFLKLMNDNHGHDRGDEYLKNCCAVICHVYTHSPVFRVGGDEFTVLLMGEDYENREELLNQVQAEFGSTSKSAKPWERLSVAMGMAEYKPETDDKVETVLRRADRKMYLNKKKMKAVRTA